MGVPSHNSILWETGRFPIRWLRYDCVSKACFTLGVRANVQPKSSIPIGAKSWNWPQGLYTRSQGWNRKETFQSAPSTNKCWTLWPCIGPKAGKRIPSNLGGQFATLGANVPEFINMLMSMFYHLLVTLGQFATQKCSKLDPQGFLALTPSVKWA